MITIDRYSQEQREAMAEKLHTEALRIAEEASECMAAERIKIHDDIDGPCGLFGGERHDQV